MFSQPSFLIPAAGAFVLAVAHQIVVWRRWPNDWARWFRHEPAYSLFLIVFFPVAFGAVSRLAPPLLSEVFTRVPMAAASLAAVLLLVFVVSLVVQDLNRQPFHPYLLRAPSAIAVEGALREALDQDDYTAAIAVLEAQERVEPPNPRHSAALITALEAARELVKEIETAQEGSKKRGQLISMFDCHAADAYFALFRPMAGVADLRARGSIVLWTHLLLAVVSVGTAVFMFVAIVVTMAGKDPATKVSAFRSLLVPTTLLVTWFPIRLYSEWYLAFESHRFLPRYQSLILLSTITIIGIIALLVLAKPDSPQLVFNSVAAIAGVTVSALAYFKPSVLNYVKIALDNMTILAYFALAFVLMIGALGVTATFGG